MYVIDHFETLADGEGLRYSIYLAGCTHHCKGCHNIATHNPFLGKPLEDEWMAIYNGIRSRKSYISGITLSGGDPFYDPQALLMLLRALKGFFPMLTIWVFTGYTLEELLQDTARQPLLEYIDTLVDGPYEEDKRVEGFYYGSSNQRIIHLKNRNIEVVQD